MTDSQKLDYLVENVGLIARETAEVKREVAAVKDAPDLKRQVTPQEERMASLEQEVEALKQKMMLSEKRMNSLEQEIISLRKSYADIRIYQENVLLQSLKKIAEGHVNVKRQLNELWCHNMEEEIQYLRLNVLEYDIDRIKEKLA